jgi:hypothetical protein
VGTHLRHEAECGEVTRLVVTRDVVGDRGEADPRARKRGVSRVVELDPDVSSPSTTIAPPPSWEKPKPPSAVLPLSVSPFNSTVPGTSPEKVPSAAMPPPAFDAVLPEIVEPEIAITAPAPPNSPIPPPSLKNPSDPGARLPEIVESVIVTSPPSSSLIPPPLPSEAESTPCDGQETLPETVVPVIVSGSVDSSSMPPPLPPEMLSVTASSVRVSVPSSRIAPPTSSNSPSVRQLVAYGAPKVSPWVRVAPVIVAVASASIVKIRSVPPPSIVVLDAPAPVIVVVPPVSSSAPAVSV